MKPNVLRLSIMLLGFLALLGLLVAKLADIQIAKHAYYEEIAGNQHGFERPIPAPRGSILDRNHRPLAASLPAYRVSADPGVIEDPEGTVSALAGVMAIDSRRLSRRLAELESRYELIKLAVDVETGLEIQRLGLQGICVEAVGRRVRPLGDVACNITGSLSAYDEPLGGIELTFDQVLRGEPGIRRYLRDALGHPRPCMEAIVKLPVAGSSLVLTIDADLQHIAEVALEAAVAYHEAKGGCVVIVDPASGDVLAIANVSDNANFPVRAIFEPGSSLKICTYAAALDLGRVDSTAVFDTHGGKLKVPGGWISDDHPRDYPLSLREAFAISSNVAASMVASRIGEADFYRYLRAFGFGCKTGLPLKGESRGILREPAEWSRRSLQTLAIGQEIGVTAIQLTMAYAAVANRGVLMEPRLVKAVLDESGKVVKKYPAKTVRRVVRQETADKMVSLLEAVVQEGTGKPAGIDGIRVAGKTGTGQKAANGHYIAGKYYSVFAGIIPDGRTRYVCLVMLDEPSAKGHYGGPVCGPVFKEVMSRFLKNERNLFPGTCAQLATLKGSVRREMPAVVTSSPSCPAGSSVPRPAGLVYPEVLGLTLREAARVLARAGLEWSAAGSGVVVAQRPGAGEAAGERGVCKLILGPAR
jgi:cell division protein FtsI/penicillin-binding protein 2